MRILKRVQERYFKDILEGRKTYEVRLADFKCKEGDTLVLLEQKQGTTKSTGRKVELEVLYKLNSKKVTKFYSKKDIEKYGLLILAVRRKFRYKK